MAIKPNSKNQFYVTFQSSTPGIQFEGAFAKMSGGAVTKTSTTVRDGGALQPYRVSGFVEYEDVTLTRPYVRDRDSATSRAVLDELTRNSGSVQGVLSWSPTDADLVPFSGEAVMFEAEITKVQLPELDSDESTGAEIQYMLAILQKI